MIVAADLLGVAAIISSSAVLVAAAGAAFAQITTAKRVEHKMDMVHEEVRTANGLRLGQLADKAETRAVDLIASADRTPAEAEHIEAVPPVER